MLMESEHSSQYSDSGLAGLDLSQVSRQAKRRNNQYKALSLSFRHGCQCVHKIFTVLVVRVWHSALGQSGTEFESPLAGILDRVLNLTGNRLGVQACWPCAVSTAAAGPGSALAPRHALVIQMIRFDAGAIRIARSCVSRGCYSSDSDRLCFRAAAA